MSRIGIVLLFLAAWLLALTLPPGAQENHWPKELDPDAPVPGGDVRGDVPDLVFGSPTNGPPFQLKDHFAVGTEARACAGTLSKAAVAQDIGNAFASAAHFDNCAFEEGLAYIRDRQLAAASDFATAQKAIAAAGRVDATARRSALSGLFRLGQALHAVQDFYSHSNYVELMEEAIVNLEDVVALPFFNGASDQTIPGLVKDRKLVSGRWTIGFPKRCAANALTHDQLAKDHDDSGKGKDPTKWGQSYHFVALVLARRSTASFLHESAQTWPAIAAVCGPLLGMNAPRDLREEKGN